jgi:Tfp pilus assembly protein PilE
MQRKIKGRMKQSNGITLIAVVITIIILLILAGITVSQLTGNKGIINMAQKAKETTKKAELEETVSLAIQNLQRNKTITPSMIADYINSNYDRTNVTAETNAFPTNIIFAEENVKVGVSRDFSVRDEFTEGEYREDLEDTISLLQVAEGNLADVHEILQRMAELTVHASNNGIDAQDLYMIQQEISDLIEEIDRIASETEYNDEKLLDGTFSGYTVDLGDEVITISINNMNSKKFGIKDINVQSGDTSKILTKIYNAIQLVSETREMLGNAMNAINAKLEEL